MAAFNILNWDKSHNPIDAWYSPGNGYKLYVRIVDGCYEAFLMGKDGRFYAQHPIFELYASPEYNTNRLEFTYELASVLENVNLLQ